MPSYHTSPVYLNRVNISNTVIVNNTINVNVTNVTYVNRSAPGAVMAVQQAAFVSAKPVQSAAIVVRPEAIRSAPVVAASAVAPTRASVLRLRLREPRWCNLRPLCRRGPWSRSGRRLRLPCHSPRSSRPWRRMPAVRSTPIRYSKSGKASPRPDGLQCGKCRLGTPRPPAPQRTPASRRSGSCQPAVPKTSVRRRATASSAASALGRTAACAAPAPAPAEASAPLAPDGPKAAASRSSGRAQSCAPASRRRRRNVRPARPPAAGADRAPQQATAQRQEERRQEKGRQERGQVARRRAIAPASLTAETSSCTPGRA